MVQMNDDQNVKVGLPNWHKRNAICSFAVQILDD